MAKRHSILASPLRVVGAAIVVILLFALAYPFAGGFSETVSQTDVNVTYALEPSSLSETALVATVFAKSLDLSVQTFTLIGSPDTRLLGAARYLGYLESLLGMGFVGLFAASLVRAE